MRKWLAILAIAIAALLAATAGPAAAREPERVIVVGDLHGDFAAWREIAKASGISKKGKGWTGGKSILVQMGDVTDRGPDSLKIIRHLQRLEKEAAKKGGHVTVLLGNHEAMNVIGDLRYVDPGEYAAFVTRGSGALRERLWQVIAPARIAEALQVDPSATPESVREAWFAQTPLGLVEHRKAWTPGGELAQWAATRPAIAQIGTDLFVHGGLSLEFSSETLDTINTRHAAALASGPEVDRSILEDQLGPLWYRGNIAGQQAEGVRPSPEGELTAVLARYGARRLIVAHTPSLSGIEVESNGRLVRVDTGISAYYGGPASYLEIKGGLSIAHQRGADGKWMSRVLEAPSAGEETE